MSGRSKERSHSPRYIKGPSLRNEEKINPPELWTEFSPVAMQSQDNEQHQCIYRTCRTSNDVRLTIPAGDTAYQYPYWSDYPPASSDVAWGDGGEYDWPNQLWWQGYPYPFASSRPPEGYDGSPLPGIGGNVNPAMPVDYNPPYEGTWPDSEDPGGLPRCGTGPGGPIHLTTNISMASSQVSYPHLFEEVCRHSVWKARWY